MKKLATIVLTAALCSALFAAQYSMNHEDFMIGYEGLDIDAITRDGKTVPIFRRGKWAF